MYFFQFKRNTDTIHNEGTFSLLKVLIYHAGRRQLHCTKAVSTRIQSPLNINFIMILLLLLLLIIIIICESENEYFVKEILQTSVNITGINENQ